MNRHPSLLVIASRIAFAFATLMSLAAPTSPVALAQEGGGSSGKGGGDEDGLPLQTFMINAVEEYLKIFPHPQASKIRAKAMRAQILMSDDPLNLWYNGKIIHPLATNDRATLDITIDRKRWNEISDFRLRKAILVHEVLSLARLESTGRYPLSAPYLDRLGGKLEQLNGIEMTPAQYYLETKKFIDENPNPSFKKDIESPWRQEQKHPETQSEGDEQLDDGRFNEEEQEYDVQAIRERAAATGELDLDFYCRDLQNEEEQSNHFWRKMSPDRCKPVDPSALTQLLKQNGLCDRSIGGNSGQNTPFERLSFSCTEKGDVEGHFLSGAFLEKIPFSAHGTRERRVEATGHKSACIYNGNHVGEWLRPHTTRTWRTTEMCQGDTPNELYVRTQESDSTLYIKPSLFREIFHVGWIRNSFALGLTQTRDAQEVYRIKISPDKTASLEWVDGQERYYNLETEELYRSYRFSTPTKTRFNEANRSLRAKR